MQKYQKWEIWCDYINVDLKSDFKEETQCHFIRLKRQLISNITIPKMYGLNNKFQHL